MSSCRQILGLLKVPLVTIQKRFHVPPAERLVQQALLSAPSNPQSSSPSIANSTSAFLSQNQIPGARPIGTPCDPNAPVEKGYRRFTKEEIEKTFEAEAEARKYSVY